MMQNIHTIPESRSSISFQIAQNKQAGRIAYPLKCPTIEDKTNKQFQMKCHLDER